jgi:dihydrofolate synthase/folylpolyglutamate synthase
VGEPRQALEEARAAAGPDGVALATGTIYLIADLLRPEGAERRSTL